MSTTTSSTGLKKKNKLDNDVKRDRKSKKRSLDKEPLFDTINKIIKNANQSSKKQGQTKKVGLNPKESFESDASQMKVKKQKTVQTMPSASPPADHQYNSGSSFDDDDDAKSKGNQTNNSANEEEDSDLSDDASDSKGVIKDTVDSSSGEDEAEKETKMEKRVEYKKKLSDQSRTNLQWHVRNRLFQQVKIVDETLLEKDGEIIQEALEKIEVDKSSPDINAYVNDCRRIIKRALSSRRGYVKHEMGVKLKCEFCTALSIVSF